MNDWFDFENYQKKNQKLLLQNSLAPTVKASIDSKMNETVKGVQKQIFNLSTDLQNLSYQMQQSVKGKFADEIKRNFENIEKSLAHFE